jgi:hypothetical protein
MTFMFAAMLGVAALYAEPAEASGTNPGGAAGSPADAAVFDKE